MKNFMIIFAIGFFALIFCLGCTEENASSELTASDETPPETVPNEQLIVPDETTIKTMPNQEKTSDETTIDALDDNEPIGIPSFFNDIGKTLSELKDEYPRAEFFVQSDGFPDAATACFGEPEAPYAYFFFGGHSGDFKAAMEECEDQLKCAGFLTTTSVLFPGMKDDMSFLEFFSWIGVPDYTYWEEETIAAGWLHFTYNNMDVWLNTNEARADGGWDFPDDQIVRGSDQIIITNGELSSQNSELAKAVMFK